MSGASAERRAGHELAAVAGLAVILAITAVWWALALWPLPADAPAWVARARGVCFGAEPNGLPDAEGWIALIVQPALMLGTLLAVWGGSLARGLTRVTATAAGKSVVVAVGLILLSGAAAGAWRVQTGLAASTGTDRPPAESFWVHEVREAPNLALIDQHGTSFSLRSLRGRPVVVTFAFGHCETVCPLIVHNVLAARRASGGAMALVVVTLDPWRDTPSRLPHIAQKWDLGPEDRLLSGSVSGVNQALDEWKVPRSRNPINGDIAHPPLAYLIDRAGTIVYRTNANAPLPKQW